jgi:hypothetical protein
VRPAPSRAACTGTGRIAVEPSESQTPVPGERRLHHQLRVLAHRVAHALVRAVMPHGRGVVVGAEVRGLEPALRGRDQRRERRAPVRVHDELRRLTMTSNRSTPASNPSSRSSPDRRSANTLTCSAIVTLGSVR